MIEIDNPSHANAWGTADPSIIAHCDGVTGNVPLNPANNRTYDYVIGVIEEAILNGTAKDLDLVPLLHLGGDEMVKECWEADAEISAYMTENNLDSNGLWLEWSRRITELVNERFASTIRPLTVYWDEMI